jgi:hypothetical protein
MFVTLVARINEFRIDIGDHRLNPVMHELQFTNECPMSPTN